jgi:hypothetical protein
LIRGGQAAARAGAFPVRARLVGGWLSPTGGRLLSCGPPFFGAFKE